MTAPRRNPIPLILFTFAFLASSQLVAQDAAEERSEWVRELDEELRDARGNAERLQGRLDHARRRIELLSRMRKLAIEAQKTEARLEQAERRDDDDAIEELEGVMLEIEVTGETLERRMRLHEHRGEIHELRRELPREQLLPLRKDLDRLLEKAEEVESQLESWTQARLEED
ncbi:MAG: hypothetical protein AAFU85_06770, partial [Planctomycetota bacterium]